MISLRFFNWYGDIAENIYGKKAQVKLYDTPRDLYETLLISEYTFIYIIQFTSVISVSFSVGQIKCIVH